MFRTLAAFLLVSSACASAQSTHVAEDQKRFQGIWRVRDALGSAKIAAPVREIHLAFDGNKWLSVVGPEPGVEWYYSLDPTKDPKQINLIEEPPKALERGPKQPAPPQVIFGGIYAFDQDRLKLNFATERRGQRPANFSAVRGSDHLLILERDNSEDGWATVKEARAILAIRKLGAKAFFNDARLGPPTTLYVKLDRTEVDALLRGVVPQIKALSRGIELQLDDSGVTDAGLASLEGVNNIGHINLKGTAITDAGLRHLRNMTHLGLLIVSETNVTDAGVASLKKSLPHLQVTHLSHAESDYKLAITNAGGTEYPDENGRLIEIRFTPGKLNDFQLLGLQKHLEVWKSTLRSIDLTDCHITDRGLAALAGLTSLRQLTLKGTDVTVAGVKSLMRTVPNLKVKH
jgi:uncharacterized protein (TIGR03067 family)